MKALAGLLYGMGGMSFSAIGSVRGGGGDSEPVRV